MHMLLYRTSVMFLLRCLADKTRLEVGRTSNALMWKITLSGRERLLV